MTRMMPRIVTRPTLVLAFCLLLPGCTFLYLSQPIPDAQMMPPRLELSDSPGLSLRGDELVLRVRLHSVPQENWLAVQWHDPRNRVAASDSIWVTPEERGQTRNVFFPSDVPLRPGLWRAVVSFEGQLVRQFSVTVPADTP